MVKKIAKKVNIKNSKMVAKKTVSKVKVKEIKKIPYEPKNIENKWAEIWEKQNLYKTKIDLKKKKMHVLDMFPYPSGEGLHTGHAKIFGASDTYTRFKRMQGFNVLHAQGYDAFGLPAEQFAIKMKTNPKIQTKKNTENFEKQMKMLGFSYDWEREINTTDPEFYKWTQWIFKQLYKAGLCHESFEPINWCPSCKTGLANEDLEDGKCERCSSVVEKKPIRQWVIKITDYAEKLLSGLDEVAWKENIKDMQRNWIGKSEGVEIEFKIVQAPTLTLPHKGREQNSQNPNPYPQGKGTVPLYRTANLQNYDSLQKKALEMRKNGTEAEEFLWQNLKGDKLNYSFRRQHLIDNFIVDFVWKNS
jgi:leucyl-tRNA synthetase